MAYSAIRNHMPFKMDNLAVSLIQVLNPNFMLMFRLLIFWFFWNYLMWNIRSITINKDIFWEKFITHYWNMNEK